MMMGPCPRCRQPITARYCATCGWDTATSTQPRQPSSVSGGVGQGIGFGLGCMLLIVGIVAALIFLGSIGR